MVVCTFTWMDFDSQRIWSGEETNADIFKVRRYYKYSAPIFTLVAQ